MSERFLCLPVDFRVDSASLMTVHNKIRRLLFPKRSSLYSLAWIEVRLLPPKMLGVFGKYKED